MSIKSQERRGRAATLFVRVVKMFCYGIVGATLMLVAVGILFMNDKPDLSPWHTADLDEEYRVGSRVETFEEYLELEDRLFAELETEIYDRISDAEKQSLNRYHRGSRADPSRWPTNWNRSYELPVRSSEGSPMAGVLLLHGLTDSPYSLRHLGAHLHECGVHVLALRIPGHGTAPASLAETRWEDMAGAVELAMNHLSKRVTDGPLYILGYSNGGALALHYALRSLEDSGLPTLSGLALLSPEIGVTKMAAMAIWQQRMAGVLGMEKLKWQSTGLEYDPFKYVSFPVSAGSLAHELTGVNRAKILQLAEADQLDRFPPLLAFQSAIDSTVAAPALVRDLFSHLPPNRHELVAFDVDRVKEIEPLLKRDPRNDVGLILDNANRGFVFTLLTNMNSESSEIVIRAWQPGESGYSDSPTSYRWPHDVFSLSHVSLPFPSSDPVYGNDPSVESPGGINIGGAALRGEKGAISISASDILRLRWNPFYPYLEQRITEHFKLEGQAAPGSE